MKRTFVVFLTLGIFASLALGQITGGTYTVGGGGSPNYATLTAAVAALNGGVSGGPVIFTIMGDLSEAGDVQISTSASLTVTNTLTIKPGTSITATITLTSGSAIKTGGADYITIDGSNAGSTDRSLTIKHSGTSAGNSVVWIEGLSDNIVVKNCILGDATNTPDFGVKTSGTSGNKINNLTIQNNEIHGIGNTNGIIYLLHVQGTNLISGNTISGDQVGSSQAFGIYLADCAGTTLISKNRIPCLN